MKLSSALCNHRGVSLSLSFSTWQMWKRMLLCTTRGTTHHRDHAMPVVYTHREQSADLRKSPCHKHRPFVPSYHTYSPLHVGRMRFLVVPVGCMSFSSQINRLLASNKPMSEVDVKRQIEQLTEKFMEARELLDDAVESKGTVYFVEDLQDAREAIEETLTTYQAFLNALNPEQKQNVLRTIGLKMEELKAHERSIVDELKND